ncbi:MAG: hypothetical protein A2Y62_13850 [Candidatus Fischerbacteria bacterium RBG_13_37_8]|uniref:DUF4410 domain-containing protein n=1 Tax=Candidatus Fischerbacteria bacterium RBG_13_37_8 TaxID=1817863 RepID=A0A1F5VXR4_9BACT|nr:MAG: hypothetical protein A2Y62_13850 [Candidatus Fischerbacteria bacterium RBG_13_37_8]
MKGKHESQRKCISHVLSMHPIVNLTLIISLLVFLNACAGSKIQPSTPMQTKLANYKSITINITSKIPGDEAMELERVLIEKLRKKRLFASVKSSRYGKEVQSDLQLNITIVDLRRVGGAARFFAGMFAGRAKVAVEGELIDNKESKSIASFKAEGMTGEHGYAGTTSQAIEKTANEIVEYLKKNI